jgi:hypothetical protein
MKKTTQILHLKGRQFRTVADVRRVLFTVIDDIRTGKITPAQSRKIYKEVNQRMKEVKAALNDPSKFKGLEKFFGKGD